MGVFAALLAARLVSACDVDNPPRLFGLAMVPPVLGPGHSLKLLVQNGYLPQSPVLVRLEVRKADNQRDWALWDAEATLSVDQPGITLSTNRFMLRNGLGSVLLSITGSGNFNLIASVGGLQTNHLMQSLAGVPITTIGGILPGTSSTWSGIMLVTNDVTIPATHTLTIQSNTLVLVNGSSSNSTAPKILVSGAILSMGTEGYPVTITTTNMALNWGQIRHTSALPSTYLYTTINKGGRAAGEGHTGTGPIIRPTNSRIYFEGCNITDAVATVITNGIGKIMMADGSNITFNNCLLARARMGPEIAGTALLCTNSYIMEMFGTDDADGIYLHDAGAQSIKITGTVVAFGDDDGIDTLASAVQIDNTIVRDYCDKGISILDGQATVDKCLIVDDTNGISTKSASSNTTIPVSVSRSTIAVATNGIAVINKYGGPTNVAGVYRVTNCTIRAFYSVVTDYNPTNFHLSYCNVTPSFSGLSNAPPANAALAAVILSGVGMTTNSPLFVSQINNDYHLQPYSPCIDAGDPASPLDPDGSRRDVGFYTFVPPTPMLSNPQMLGGGTYQFTLDAYTNRNYVVEFSTNTTTWNFLTSSWQFAESTAVNDATATNSPQRIYRARLAP